MGAEWGDMGCLMLCNLELLIPLFTNQEIDFMKVLSRGLPVWILGGLCFGFSMKRYYKDYRKDS